MIRGNVSQTGELLMEVKLALIGVALYADRQHLATFDTMYVHPHFS